LTTVGGAHNLASVRAESGTGSDSPTRDGTFRTTHWSVVLAAREQDDSSAQAAMAKLCSAYWYPLYAFVRRQGLGPHDAEDLTQEFFCRVLEKNSLRNVQPAGGRFRSFLLVCLKHFLANERERAQAQRRGGGQSLIPLDGGEAETRYSLEPADKVTPEVLFEKHWAFAVLDHAMQALEQEFASKEKSGAFEELKGFLPGGQAGPSRAELAAKRGISASAVDVAIHRLRQRFGALLREQVAQTVASPDEVEEEIRYLISVLGS
jgi:DNA-directed RNA polymerase specialized sigma24 family protein